MGTRWERLSATSKRLTAAKQPLCFQILLGADPKAWAPSQGVNHHYTREERLRLADVDGIDYLPPNSAVFRRWLAKQPHRRGP